MKGNTQDKLYVYNPKLIWLWIHKGQCWAIKYILYALQISFEQRKATNIMVIGEKLKRSPALSALKILSWVTEVYHFSVHNSR